jgi:3,4-dihydroxy 2-butanone 4-phosphate synthase/GTP cyclohydrolase II
MTVLEYRRRPAARTTLDAAAALARVRRAASGAARGGLTVVTDHSAGYLAVVAECATADAIAFTVRHSSGFIRVAMAADECRRLGLALLGAAFEAGPEAMTVSVDAADGVTTGISACDRARTIRLLAQSTTSADDLSRPGHVVPVRIAAGGVLEWAGVPEAVADLAAAGGAEPAAAYAELAWEQGPLLTASEAEEFALRHRLPAVSVSDLVQCRLAAAQPDPDCAVSSL